MGGSCLPWIMLYSHSTRPPPGQVAPRGRSRRCHRPVRRRTPPGRCHGLITGSAAKCRMGTLRTPRPRAATSQAITCWQDAGVYGKNSAELRAGRRAAEEHAAAAMSMVLLAKFRYPCRQDGTSKQEQAERVQEPGVERVWAPDV